MFLLKSWNQLAMLMVLSATLLAAPRAGVSADLCDSNSYWRRSVCTYIGNVRAAARLLHNTTFENIDTANAMDTSPFGLLNPASVSDLDDLLVEENKYLINFNNCLTAMKNYEAGPTYRMESFRRDNVREFQRVKSILFRLTGLFSHFIRKLQEQVPVQDTPAIPVSEENASVANRNQLYTALEYLARQQYGLMSSWDVTCTSCPNSQEKRETKRLLMQNYM